MSTSLRIAIEPLDAHRYKFIVNQPVAETGRVHKYVDAASADTPVAQAVLTVPGVSQVVVSANVVTVAADDGVSWETIGPQVQYAIETALRGAGAGAPRASAASPSPPDDDTLYALVSDIFVEQINPTVAQHGGKVELIDVQAGVVVLRMLGGCQGCGMANVTLRQGIEGSLRRMVPGFAGLKDITDHAAGTKPYFGGRS